MDTLFVVGRVVFVTPFLVIGMDRVLRADESAPYPESRAAGLVGVGAGLSVGLGLLGDVGAAVLVLQCLVVAAAGHQIHGDVERTLPWVALAGASLVVFTVYAVLGEGLDYTLTDQLVSIDP